MIPKSGYRFSEKIMLNKAVEQDDDSKKNHPALDLFREKSIFETRTILQVCARRVCEKAEGYEY
jgi:hypothetical protein